jgi:hypothetical protein
VPSDGRHCGRGEPEFVELLVALGDSYARNHNWKDALLAYQLAQAQIPNNLTGDDPALQALRDRISAGIALGQEQQPGSVLI